MKVSKEKREEIRRALIGAAVAVVVERGLAEMTIREVAARAEVAPGTAYKYFPNRDQLIYAYFELKLADAQSALEGVPGFGDFSFKEKLQAFLEALLAEYLAEREFVGIALRGLIDSPFQAVGVLDPIKRGVLSLVESYLNDARQEEQLAAGSGQVFMLRAFWDFTILTVLYWLNDDSEGFVRTSEFIDHGLDLYVALIRSGIADKAVRLGGFLLRNHLRDHLNPIASLLGSLGSLHDVGTGKPDDHT